MGLNTSYNDKDADNEEQGRVDTDERMAVEIPEDLLESQEGRGRISTDPRRAERR